MLLIRTTRILTPIPVFVLIVMTAASLKKLRGMARGRDEFDQRHENRNTRLIINLPAGWNPRH